MALWTDIIDPATLTGYARDQLEAYEQAQGNLAVFLPNRMTPGIDVRFMKGDNGLVPVAEFRAFDAEIAIGERKAGKRVTIEMPALGKNIPVSEYEQLRANGAVPSDETVLGLIQATTRQVVRSAADSIERLRGIVINTGKATITQANFAMDDSFGRPGGNNVVLTGDDLWTDEDSDPLSKLEELDDLYREATGQDPGAYVGSSLVLRTLAKHVQLQTQLGNGGSRPATFQQVQDTLAGAGHPEFIRYNRRVNVRAANGAASLQRVLPNDRLFILPAPVDPNDWMGTDLGATFWGRTLTSTEGDWAIEEPDQPGIVAGVYRNEKPPMTAEVLSDAIGLPVLANAQKSMSIKVI